ncbi:MAG: flagellar brake protein [Planctomycetota bacterium]|jgi:c-di-GMP-binding flagellar brake protein YcgR
MKSGKINTDVVLDACRRCFPVDLWTQHKIGTIKYAGSLLATENSGNNTQVRASIRLPDKETEPPIRGTEVRAFFLNAGGIYSYKSTILDWSPYKDAKDRGIVTMAFPDQIKIAQRRSFFRVPYPLNNRSNIEVSVNFRDEKHVVKGMIKDLSGGGIALRCVKSPMNFFELGTKVELAFCLPRRTERIQLNAVVTRVEEEDSHYFFGLKFVDHFRSAASRSYINLILQYIFQFERMMLNL